MFLGAAFAIIVDVGQDMETSSFVNSETTLGEKFVFG